MPEREWPTFPSSGQPGQSCCFTRIEDLALPGAERLIEPLGEAPDSAGVHAQIRAIRPGAGSKIDPRQPVLVQPDTNFEIVFKAEEPPRAPDPNKARQIVRLEYSPPATLLDECHT